MRNATLVLSLVLFGCGAGRTTPLADSVRAGDVSATESLLTRGADPNEATGSNGWPPLLHAIHKHQLATAEVLLQHGADVNRGNGAQTPLTMAAGYGDTKMIALLLQHGADPARRDGNGATPIDAAISGTTDIDEFTYFRCQDDAVALLARAAPAVRPAAGVMMKLKRCKTV
jgi:hypothetical protein